jgi:hypothetical protein
MGLAESGRASSLIVTPIHSIMSLSPIIPPAPPHCLILSCGDFAQIDSPHCAQHQPQLPFHAPTALTPGTPGPCEHLRRRHFVFSTGQRIISCPDCDYFDDDRKETLAQDRRPFDGMKRATVVPSLAPKPKVADVAWRSLMTPEELKAYERGDYNRAATAPRESDRISRDNRLVTLNEKLHDAAKGTPEDTAQIAELTRALRIIAATPGSCVMCADHLSGKGEPRVAILTDDRVYVYCQGCFDAMGVPLETEGWFAGLPVMEQAIWSLLKEGLSQHDIAARLTVGAQTVTQQTVSKTKIKILALIREKGQATELYH